VTNPHIYPVFCLHFFTVVFFFFSSINRIQEILRALWRELNSQGMVRSCEFGGADVQGLICVIDAWDSLSAALLFLVGYFLNPHSVVFSLTAFPFSFSTLSPLCRSNFPSEYPLCLLPPMLSLIVAYLYLLVLIHFYFPLRN